LGAVAQVEHLHAVHRCSPAEKKVSGARRRFWRFPAVRKKVEGWMTQVASIPDAPPLTKGFTVGHTPVALDFFWSPILFLDSKTERLGAQRERGRDSKRKKKWLPQKKKNKKLSARKMGNK
jgi:hypothetical protein